MPLSFIVIKAKILSFTLRKRKKMVFNQLNFIEPERKRMTP